MTVSTITGQLQSALSMYEAGEYEAATRGYLEVVAQHEQNVEAWYRLGMLMVRANEPAVALQCITNAITHGGPSAERCCCLAQVCLALNQPEQAEASWRQALQLQANDVAAMNELTVALLERNQPEAAAELCRHVLVLKPADATARTNLGNILKHQGLYQEALTEFQAVLRTSPQTLDALTGTAEALLAVGQVKDAKAMCHRALQLRPGLRAARACLSLIERHDVQEKCRQFRSAIESNEQDDVAWEGLGQALAMMGDIQPAVEAFSRAVELNPERRVSRSNLIYCSQFLPDITAQRMADLYQEWDRWHAQPLSSVRPNFTNDRSPDRKLRLGILSPGFRRHAAALLIVLGLEHLDRSQFETCYYADLKDADDMTDRFRRVSDRWQVVHGMSDSALAEKIYNDGIDILIVMAGHTGLNRQLVAARKPAPVQIAWTADPSGQSAVDWLIADRFLIPEELERFYTESILRMPHDYTTFDPPSDELKIGPTPSASSGQVTFGSFNQAVKCHSPLLELWADIMQRLPESRLIMVGAANTENRERLLAPFRDAGIGDDRIELSDRVDRNVLLESYNRVDVSLDPFPFSGGVTTLESLWMGVPVVTLASETFAGRTALTHLSNAGLGDLVAQTPEEYADMAVQLAQDTERLAGLRRQLREDLRSSPVCDGPRFGRDLGDGLRRAWRAWAEKQ